MTKRTYDKDFKQEACKMVVEDGRKIRYVEDSLGITRGVLKDWVKNYRNELHGTPVEAEKASEEKFRRLEKELVQVCRERDILKKAVAIFSKDPNPFSGL